ATDYKTNAYLFLTTIEKHEAFVRALAVVISFAYKTIRNGEPVLVAEYEKL
ncbi:MAG: hypothetical protein JWR72_1097, partial [Flavisolibacter sp.]|nr:hypothetical protein [Flavisolibacter sp.]